MIVKSTRHGVLGKRTASGYVVDVVVPFVALPSVGALGRAVHVTNCLNGQCIVAIVLDAGPYNEHDDEYVFQGARPAVESGKDEQGHETDRAGIALGPAVWRALGMHDNTDVHWMFLC